MEAKVLSEMLDKTRAMTRWYISKMKDVDMHRTFEVEGKTLNSAFWITAHLAVTENWLTLTATNGSPVDIPWRKQFSMGSEIPKPEDCPPIKEVLDKMKEVHAAAMEHISSLTDEQLAQPNAKGWDFGGTETVKGIIQHAIRHEGTHTGHLSWLCKLHGIHLP